MSALDPRNRFHNQENLSSQDLGDMLREIQGSVELLNDRIDELSGQIQLVKNGAGRDTRRLGTEVITMGQALASRVRTVENFIRSPTPQPAPTREPLPRRQSSAGMVTAMALFSAVFVGGIWTVTHDHSFDAMMAMVSGTTGKILSPGSPAVATVEHGRGHRLVHHRSATATSAAEPQTAGLVTANSQ